jgi:tetratricopeptide (TPR) repeat protein
MRKTFTVLICSGVLFSSAQNRIADSLERLIGQSKEDTNEIFLLRSLGYAFVFSHPDSSYYYTNLGLQLAQKLQDLKEESRCLGLIGSTISSMGNFPEALRISLKSLELAEKSNDPIAIESSFNNLGADYYFQKDYGIAMEYFVKSLTVARTIKDEEIITLSFENIGDVYLKMNKLDSALLYSTMAYQKSKDRKDEFGMVDELNNLGDIYFKLNKMILSLEYYRLALAYATFLDDKEDICKSTFGIASIYQKQNKNDSALVYGYRSLEAATGSYFNGRQLEASNLIAAVYESQSNTDSAFKYLKLTIAHKDSLFSQEKSKTLQTMTYSENIRQEELANQKKKAAEDKVRNLQLLAIGVFIPIFFLFVLFLSRTKVKPRVVEFLGIVSLLLFFEFITDLVYPYISNWTNENPVWEMSILVVLAAFLEPLNHRLEHWVKAKLVRKSKLTPIPIVVETISSDDE